MKQHQKRVNPVLQGFTLIELIVVIAIIGILLGVLAPTMSGYLTRSRLNTANANARVVFNSIQTICQELEFKERHCNSTEFYGHTGSTVATMEPITEGTLFLVYGADSAADSKQLITAEATTTGGSARPLLQILNGSYTPLTTPPAALPAASPTANADAFAYYTPNPDGYTSSFMGRMERLTSSLDEISFCAYIENYQVRMVLCASSLTTDYVGGYPTKATERDDYPALEDVTNDIIAGYAAAAWAS